MGIEYDLGVNLLAAAMGAAAGSGITMGRRFYRSLCSDTFWRFLRKPTLIVVGELHFEVILGTVGEAIRAVAPDPDLRLSIVEATTRHIGQQETSGLMGRGDFDALAALNLKHASLSFPSPSIAFDSNVREIAGTNLILIGGPDVNSVTRDLLPRLTCQLELRTDGEGGNVVYDNRLDSVYPASHGKNALNQVVEVDFGILARTLNPEDSRRQVLLFAGAHGWGTQAAAEISVRDGYRSRLRHEMMSSRAGFECLVRYEHTEIDGVRRQQFALEFSRSLRGA